MNPAKNEKSFLNLIKITPKMDEGSELVLKKLCCTCLCRDRKLFQLCRLKEGINNLYLLLSYDSEAYREGFFKDTASWHICWECWAVMARIDRFRVQACTAQKQLAHITNGRTDLKLLKVCLSRLSYTLKTTYDHTISLESDTTIDNFIDCGLDIKSESDEDIPLSELHNNFLNDHRVYSDDEIIKYEPETITTCDIQPVFKKIKMKKDVVNASKNEVKDDSNKKYFRIIQLTEEEMYESREKRKLAVVFADALFKCESCIEGFKSQIDLEKHNLYVHIEKDKRLQCDVCLMYVRKSSLPTHREEHYRRYECQFCDSVTYSMEEVMRHLKSGHSMQNLPVERTKGQRKSPRVMNPGSKPRRSQAMMDKRTPFGYLCVECNKYFDNKNQRWKHVQRHHREGYKCVTCGKRFAFKNNLTRHEQMHLGPPPREECQVCHKMVRVDLLKTHARIHTDRDRYSCAECDKCFVSRASYEHHLKYTQAHAAIDILKYKCSMCSKGYRSRGELRDHVNYQHMGKTQHKCPICGKALATRRCITRHVRRTHDGIKESARDKICQQCGKAFRDKKGLREHELIHSGERPLSCETCGCTFRQSASLYTHRRRVHRAHPSSKQITLEEGG